MKLSELIESTRPVNTAADLLETCYAAYLRRNYPLRYLRLRGQMLPEHSKSCRCLENPNPCAAGLPG